MLFQIALLLISTQFLGTEGRGELSLFILNITIVIQVSSLIGGESLVYWASRASFKQLIKNTHLWAFFALTVTTSILFVFKQLKLELLIFFLVAAALQVLLHIYQQLLLGYNQIETVNKSFIGQQLIACAGTILLFSIFEPSVEHFIWAHISGQATAVIMVGTKLFSIEKATIVQQENLLKKLLGMGTTIQLGNLAQTLNNRLAYFIINSFLKNGTGLVGLYSTALMVSEKALFIPKSFARVQYSTIANQENSNDSISTTFKFLKLTVWITIPVLITMAIVPESWYLWVIGDGFGGLKSVMLWIIPGLFMLMVSNVLSHYFSGIGKYHINSIGSFLGLITTAIGGFVFIPIYGIEVAAMVTSVSYFTLALWQLGVFYRTTSFHLSQWFIQKEDWKELKKRFRS